MGPTDWKVVLAGLPELDLDQGPTYEQAQASAHALPDFHGCQLMLARFRGQPPWEKHPGDELIVVVEGEVELTVLGEERETHRLGAGSLFLMPAHTWHRSNAPGGVAVLVATPPGGESSLAEDPRLESS